MNGDITIRLNVNPVKYDKKLKRDIAAPEKYGKKLKAILRELKRQKSVIVESIVDGGWHTILAKAAEVLPVVSGAERKPVKVTRKAEPVKPVIVLPADTLEKDCPPDWDCDECGEPMWMHKAKIPFPWYGGNLMECPEPVDVVAAPPVEVVADPEPETAAAYRAEHWQAKGLAVYGSPLAPVAEALAEALPKASVQERGNALILSRKHEAKVRTVLETLNRAA